MGLPAHNQIAVSLPVEWDSQVKCQIGEETLETSCRSTACAVRTQKHDYSWYDNMPIQRLLHRSTRSIIPQLDCGRTDEKSNRTEKERKLRRIQYHYNKHLYGFSHVSSNYHFVRIVHHRYHICRVYAQCGYGYVSSNYHFLRIVHRRYHICMVFPQCGYGCFFK